MPSCARFRPELQPVAILGNNFALPAAPALADYARSIGRDGLADELAAPKARS
jgi:hypothetical protein